jgi:hypothetical protein
MFEEKCKNCCHFDFLPKMKCNNPGSVNFERDISSDSTCPEWEEGSVNPTSLLSYEFRRFVPKEEGGEGHWLLVGQMPKSSGWYVFSARCSSKLFIKYIDVNSLPEMKLEFRFWSAPIPVLPKINWSKISMEQKDD